ncbi:MAG: glycoside hydrolase family 38 C-terminal domain-containing protein [Planctomycetota bacterium]|nr:glycoside hydrolase family 38 C-terminal domain-containing protein [Planctomycetota bacterium]
MAPILDRRTELEIKKLSVFLRDVLTPMVYPKAAPLSCMACVLPDPREGLLTPKQALHRNFRKVWQGWQWGPKWATAWFHVTGTVPPEFAGHRCVVRFSSGTEGLAWVRHRDVGMPAPPAHSPTGEWVAFQGLDVNRDEVPLFGGPAAEQNGASTRGSTRGPVESDEAIDILIEAACNHPFGVLAFEWDTADTAARWASETPGRLERCELAIRDDAAWNLKHEFEFALLLLKELEPGSARFSELLHVLSEVRRSEPIPSPAYGSPDRGTWVQAASAILRRVNATFSKRSSSVCYAVGHAHLDTAWLWPLRETKRKCVRTFVNQVRLLESHAFHFMASQAQHYAWVEELAPSVFTDVARFVRDELAKWETIGGMWIEPDLNCPSGESLVRQILHADRYWRSRFGELGRQRVLYLPDTFGFPASIPQLMKLGGLGTFITNKLHWNMTNTFPHTTFVWRGIDGSEVLSHNTPGGDYNALNTPKELLRGENKLTGPRVVAWRGEPRSARSASDQSAEQHDSEETSGILLAPWLQPFGFGDGGGGPTESNIKFAWRSSAHDGLPDVRAMPLAGFLTHLHRWHDGLVAEGQPPPVVDGELYLEIHRGTLTTQSWLKKANRRMEELLFRAELLEAFAQPHALPGRDPDAHRSTFDIAWKKLLLNQFHDILPGSSIGEVYNDARADLDSIARHVEPIAAGGLGAWASRLDPSSHHQGPGLGEPIVVFNSCSHARSGVVEIDNAHATELLFVPGEHAIAAHGVALVDAASSRTLPSSVQGVTVGGPSGSPQPGRGSSEERPTHTLDNGTIRAEIDELGRVASLRVRGVSAEFAPRPLNQLVLYHDRPHMWDAWDIDPGYEDCAADVVTPATITIQTRDAMRGEIRVERPLGAASSIVQVYRLDAGSPRLDIITRVKWQEDHLLLRALFPTDIRAPLATYDIQFGVVQRATTRNNSHEQARFENCAHRWLDLSDTHATGHAGSAGGPGTPTLGRGVAILNDAKYGHSCHDGVLGITLLRSPTHPDPGADRGEHEFTYSILPHAGDWRSANVDHHADALNERLIAHKPAASNALGRIGPAPTSNVPGERAWSPFAIECAGGCDVRVIAAKRAEGPPARRPAWMDVHGHLPPPSSTPEARRETLILRLHERRGIAGSVTLRWGVPAAHVTRLDLLECPMSGVSCVHAAQPAPITSLDIKPFEIVTLGVELGEG